MSAKEKTGGFIAEFKQFIARGNVMDLAVGVIIGGAFKTIVDSLVGDIITPFLGLFIGKDSFAALNFTVGAAVVNFGNFVEAIVNFLIMALVIFLLVKAVNAFHHKKETAPPPPPAPSGEEALLTEIRDLLKKNKEN